MRCIPKEWRKQIGSSESLYSICINQSKSELIVACSNDIIFIDINSFEIIDRRRAHQSQIYSVRVSYDESYIASSSSDGTVIIWRSSDHESIQNFGSSLSIRFLIWCPTDNTLLALSLNEYHIWSPFLSRTLCIRNKDVKTTIENGTFSRDGQRYFIGFSDGTVKVYQLETQKEIRSISYSVPLTILRTFKIFEDEYFVIADIERNIYLNRVSDNKTIKKNNVSFEPLQMIPIKIKNINYFLFCGVSNRISVFTDDLMFLTDIHLGSKMIWDIGFDSKRRLFACGADGFVEMKSLSILSHAASNENFVIYIDCLNRICFKNTSIEDNSFLLTFPSIIFSLAISSHHFLVMFKFGIFVYLYNFEDEIKPGDDFCIKKCEIPGNFENAKCDISDRNVFVRIDESLSVFSVSGILKKNYDFHSNILFLSKTEALSDGCVVCCENGSVFFVIVDQPEPVLLYSHEKAVKFAKKLELNLAFIDVENELFILNYFTSEVLFTQKNIDSFAFSDRVDGLIAFKDINSNVFIRFLDYISEPYFNDGKIISFFGNRITLLCGNTIEYYVPQVPFEKILLELNQDSLSDFYELINIGPTPEQWKCIYDIACKIDNHEIMLLSSSNLEDKITDFDIIFESSQKAENPFQLEKDGLIESAIRRYAELNDWENAFRLADSSGLELLLLEFDIPQNECVNAAKYLLKIGFDDYAFQLLKKSGNIEALAQAYVRSNKWIDAITLALSNPSVNHIVFPSFGEQLFKHENYFESLVCFYIPSVSFDHESRSVLFTQMYEYSKTYIQKSFVCLLRAFNNPEHYWELHQKSVAFYALNRLSQFLMLPMFEDEVKTVFYLSYFVIACLHRFQMGGAHYSDILIQFLRSSAILGLKKWVDYAMDELDAFQLPAAAREIVNESIKAFSKSNFASPQTKNKRKVEFLCKKCQTDLYDACSEPLLHCCKCGSKISFSAFSCEPLPFYEIGSPAECTPKISDTCDNENLSPFCIAQKLKKTSMVAPRFWNNEDVELVHCCYNCGALYSEKDFQESVLKDGMCVICHTCFDLEKWRNGNRSSILDLLRKFEEESPVSF